MRSMWPDIRKALEMDFCDEKEEGEYTDVSMQIMHLIEDHAEQAQIPVRFAASKLWRAMTRFWSV